MNKRLVFACLLASLVSLGGKVNAQVQEIRVGYFPNVTHAHALIAQNMAEEGKGWFEQRLPGVRLRWMSFNAGPSAMEAFFAKNLDITYVGPGPALNAFIRSKGEEVRVVAGALRGGSALVTPKNSALKNPVDFKGKRVATPQLGNTQDIACRNWFIQSGLHTTMTGGDVLIVPVQNSAMPALFARGDVDAAWTVEPWVSYLEIENGAQVIHSEPAKQSITTLLVSSAHFQSTNKELLKKFVEAHIQLNKWIQENPEEAQKRVSAELSRQMKREFPLKLVVHAWPRLVFDTAITIEDFKFSLLAAQNAGFLKGEHKLDKLIFQP